MSNSIELLLNKIDENDVDAVNNIILTGIDLNSYNSDGVTPLHHAIKKGHLNICKALFLGGADIEHLHDYGESFNKAPLFVAIEHEKWPICGTLISAGTNVNIIDSLGQTPLMWAAAKNKEIFTEKLIKAGAKINAKDKSGKTAMHYASMNYEGMELIKLLLEAGADINFTDNKGHTPLHDAACHGIETLSFRFLKKHGANFGKSNPPKMQNIRFKQCPNCANSIPEDMYDTHHCV